VITEQDLRQAIAECQGIRDPNANTCVKLAAFYIILDHIKEQEQEAPTYSYASPPTQRVAVSNENKSEFAAKIQGMRYEDVIAVMDELMSTISILNPALYNGVIRKLDNIS
jgi:hypothetical protein